MIAPANLRPAYTYLSRAEIEARVERARASLAECRICPRDCGVNRLEDKWAACKTGRYAVVGSWFPHFGEEDCLRGWNGSGTIFFSHCNLRCKFCFHPDTLVATDQGLARIADLFERGRETEDPRIRNAPDSRVVTGQGHEAPVARAFRHDYDGELIRLEPCDSPSILLTPSHEVFVARNRPGNRRFKAAANVIDESDRLIVPRQANGHHSSRWALVDDSYRVPIDNMGREPYQGPVYNLEVEDPDHSYLAPFVAVANCQNWEISWGIKPKESPPGYKPEAIAGMMLKLQTLGCHNINFVTPEHVVPQVVEALAIAIRDGLKLPVVYNTSAYDSLESIELMAGLVDVYMPDFKFWSPERSRTYMQAEDYPAAARAAIRAMHEQVGPLVIGADGLARRGLLVRHLVMPGMLDETRAILEWIARELGPDTYVNLMDQYYPSGKVGPDYLPEINRRLDPAEFHAAQTIARDLGLRRLDERRPHPQLARRLA